MYLTVYPLQGLGSIPAHGSKISQTFFLVDHTLPTCLEPVWQKMAQYRSMGLHNLWTLRRKALGQP